MGDSTPAKSRSRRDVFHISPGFWRRVELTASTRLTCERQEPLREEPASRRPQGPRGLGRSGRRLRLYGAAEGRSAVGSPADCEASWVWLSCARPGGEGRGEGAAFKGRPERDGAEAVRGRGCGLGGRAPCLREPHTYLLLPLSPSGSRGCCFPRLRAFPSPSREPVGVRAEEPTATLTSVEEL